MSLRLRLFTLVMRWLVQPLLAATKDPAQARREFNRMSRFLRVPPYLLHLSDPGPVPVHWISVKPRNAEWVILYFHGGGYITGSPDTHVGLAGRIAKLTGLHVASVDYRLAPEHQAPAAFEDARAAHAALLAKGYPPGRIILGGDSAGGGLALALLADLCARGVQPAGLFAFSPWNDLAMTGDSLVANEGRDPLLPVRRMPDLVEMVLGEMEPRDPRISPMYAQFDRPPPVLLQVGSVEILLDDSCRMAEVLRQADGDVRLAIWPGCPHVWHLLDGYLPEARQALLEVRDFVDGLQVTALSPRQDGS
jgi:monoterpene epsilon-lactone hydrolase